MFRYAYLQLHMPALHSYIQLHVETVDEVMANVFLS